MIIGRRIVQTLTNILQPVLTNERLMSRFGITVCHIRYQGRRSGTPFELYAWCKPGPNSVRIDVAAPQNKNWWRNFTGSPHPIEVEYQGKNHVGTAVSVGKPPGKVHVEVLFREPAQEA